MFKEFIRSFSPGKVIDDPFEYGTDRFIVSLADWRGHSGLKLKLNKVPYRLLQEGNPESIVIEVPKSWSGVAEMSLGKAAQESVQYIDIDATPSSSVRVDETLSSEFEGQSEEVA